MISKEPIETNITNKTIEIDPNVLEEIQDEYDYEQCDYCTLPAAYEFDNGVYTCPVHEYKEALTFNFNP